MNKWLAKTLVGCFALLSAYALAFQDIDHSIYFPSVAQSHGSCSGAPSNQFTHFNQSHITGTSGNPLQFCSINSNRPPNGCDGQLCTVTGTSSIPSLSLTGGNAFPTWNSSTNIQCSNSQATSNTGLNEVNLSSGCSLTFLANSSSYRVKRFQLNQGAEAILNSGDYFFESANFAQNGQLKIEGDVRIFIRNSVGISGSHFNPTGAGTLTIIAYDDIQLNGSSLINGYIYSAKQLTLNGTSTINGRVTVRQLTMNADSEINQFEQQGYACFTDDFNRSSLGQNWIPYTSSGNFTPSIISNRMRLTEAITNQATAVTYQRIFPAAGNLVTVEFDYYAWANLTGNGADGVSVIFSDATVTPRTGGFGGSLGYAPRTDSNPVKPGF
ncbi:MSHA biogenesis protein MshQ, partial [Vibrio cholerae]